VDERYRHFDAEFESWFVRLYDVLAEPEGARMVAILEAGATRRDGVSGARLGGAVFEFLGHRILRAVAYEDAAEALVEIGVDPVAAFAERREDPELVVWLMYTHLVRGQSVDDLFAVDAQREGTVWPTSTDRTGSGGIAERFAELDAFYDDWSIQLADTITTADGRVVATITCEATVDGRSEAFVAAVVYEVRDGVIHRAIAFHDVHDAFDALRSAAAPSTDFSALFDIAGVGLLHNAADGSIVEANEKAAAILGLTLDQLRGRNPMDPAWRAVHEDGSPFPGDEHPVSVTLRTGVEQSDVIMGVHKPDGTLTWISVTSRLVAPDDPGAPRELLTSFTDITALMKANEHARHELESELLHDSLTGLPNRVLFMDRLQQALRQATRSDGAVAVLFLDLDRFKEINDTQGHDAGDRTLIAVGKLATSALRPGDTVARLAGDEYAVLCLDCTLAHAQEVASRILTVIAQARAQEQTAPLAASIGIALSDDGAITAHDLLAHADSAMYTAKQAGGARHATFTTNTPAT